MGEKRSLKGKHVDMLDAIARKMGVEPHEAFGHIVGRAHEEMFGSGGTQAGASAPSATSRAGEDPTTRKARHDTINAAAGAQDRSPEAKAKADAALDEVGEPHDGHDVEDSSNEHQDAPGSGRRNPLSMLKRWASTKDDDEDESEDEPAKKPAPAKAPLGGERWRGIQRQKRNSSMGKAQR